MKKIALAVVLLTAISITYAQEGNNICVWNSTQNYQQGGGADELERAIKCSDEAMVNDATSGKYKVWLYRGELYRLIYRETVLNKKYGNAAFEGTESGTSGPMTIADEGHGWFSTASAQHTPTPEQLQA